LYVNVNCLQEKSPSGVLLLNVYSVEMSLKSYQTPRNNPDTGVGDMVLWQASSIHFAGSAAGLFRRICLEEVVSRTKKFANDWLAAHPKK
jgi:hypothetical protein